MTEPRIGPDGQRAQPTPWLLFWIFTRIGLTSFGGGLSGWLYREFVRDRGWLNDEEFLNGLALSQSLPGVNVANMAIWMGHRLSGPWGAAAGLAGIIAPPAFVIILLSLIYASVSQYPLTHVILVGAAAASIGLSLSMGLTAAARLPRRARPFVIMAATFAAVALLQWPLVWVVLGAGAISVALEYADLRRS